MDFVEIRHRKRNKVTEVFPEWIIGKSKDILFKGAAFHAVWDPDEELWSTDEMRVAQMVDNEINNYIELYGIEDANVNYCRNYNSKAWSTFKRYSKEMPENCHELDSKLIFANDTVKKSDYATRKLPYSLEEGECVAWNELISTLYSKEERDKIEWAIGSILDGDSKKIQKFLVLFGEAGTGKSTILNVIEMLFEGYVSMFNAKELGSSSNSFAASAFKNNPLVAIQHDGDLSRIEDNTLLNSIVSHEKITINEKYKSPYISRINAFLFMATNKPVKITDSHSGIIRRLIDVQPTGAKIPARRYTELMDQIPFELGKIATHCIDVYKGLGRHYYDSYKPFLMMFKTDVFFNFVDDNYYELKDGITLNRAYALYKEYCDEVNINIMPRHKFREELRAYYENFSDGQTTINGERVRSFFSGFIYGKMINHSQENENVLEAIDSKFKFDDDISIFDSIAEDYPAQLANSKGTPSTKWKDVSTTLKDIDTKKLHYVKVPMEHIVIDFDIKDENGNKSFEKNLAAANKWPLTYAELSKSGQGIHLHYIYDGDPAKLSCIYDDDIEIKVFKGDSSLRRCLTKCNHEQIAHISSGLPFKKEDRKTVTFDGIKNEKAIISLIKKNLNKEIHPATKPSIDFIKKILDDAYAKGIKYDVSAYRPAITAFAMKSSHNAEYCMKVVSQMKFCSIDNPEDASRTESKGDIIFWDVEVFPNLFIVVYKGIGTEPVQLINPTPEQIMDLTKYKLVGFNNRRYDNHIMYARILGYSNEQLYELSKKIVSGSKNAMFGNAYNLSYTDIYDYASKKQSLKKWEIELGLHHQECGLPWDKPVDKSLWQMVADYCINDVVATEAVWNATQADFAARQILADISGLTVNDTTNTHTGRIIFGNEKHPQKDFVYTDLSEMFPGYSYHNGVSEYRGENPGEGGYVYAEPGIYTDVALLDIASMHPSSIENLNLFGPYTQNFSDIKSARIYIKHKEYDKAKQLFGGKLAPYLTDESQSKALSYALKIVINSVYGLTSAKFDNLFRDPRNIDNIVAKRGALFMINLKHEVQERGYTVAHIKTDSIKIPNATQEIIDFVMDYGKQYGYNFEHEATYDRMCLVNNAVYIAKYKDPHPGEWTATGAEFAHPYIMKKLFTKEQIEFEDYCETKTVTSALYLDLNEHLGEDEHDYQFVGKAGSFVPIKPGCGGGLLMREKDGKYSSATGAKGYRWLEAESVKGTDKEKDIDDSYAKSLVDAAIDHIKEYGDFEWFVS